MILPEKYMNLEQCALTVAGTILEEIKQVLVLPLAQVEDLVASQLGDAALTNLQGAINILYLLGLIDYDEDNDVFLYREEDLRGAE